MSSRSPASASSLDVASASPLPTLPDELVDRVAGMCARRGGLREWCRSWRGTCRRLADVAWFEKNARGGAPIAIVPSAACPTVQMGLSRAVEAPPRADVRSDSDAPLTSSRAIDPDPDPDAIVREPIVLVKPGTYPENVRVTSSCALLGWGDPADVVIEARGWEPALAFAGLGARRSRSLVGALPREDGAPRRRAPRHRRRPRRRSARGRRRGRPRRQPHRVREERDAELRRRSSSRGNPAGGACSRGTGSWRSAREPAPRMTACVVRRARGAAFASRTTRRWRWRGRGWRRAAARASSWSAGEMRMDRCVVAETAPAV